MPLDSFGSHKAHKDGLQNYCRPCRNLLNKNLLTPEQKERKKKNSKRYAFSRTVRRRGQKYGITQEDYQRMLDSQSNVCAICGGYETWEHSRLCVDHCHKTGKVRGLLCSRCNKALGGFWDDTAILSKAIDYLQAARVEVQQQKEKGKK